MSGIVNPVIHAAVMFRVALRVSHSPHVAMEIDRISQASSNDSPERQKKLQEVVRNSQLAFPE